MRALEVKLQRNQGVSLLRDKSEELQNLFLVHQQLFGAKRVAVEYVSVLVRADVHLIYEKLTLIDRAKRILHRCECNCICDAKDFALKRDKMRQDYYNYFTGRNWGEAANYDITFNTSVISIDHIADIIIDIITKR